MPKRLLITATALEAEPLKGVTDPKPLPFSYGELFKLEAFPETYLAHLGIAKVNTAAGLALAIQELSPDEVIQFGIGGAFVGSFLSIGMLAVADTEIHLDTGVKASNGWQDMSALGFPLVKKNQDFYNVIPTDERLSNSFAKLGANAVRFGTSETVTGSFEEAASFQERFDVSVESMEGAAAAQVCLTMDISFAEVRAVSNIVGERDKGAWNIPLAIREVNDLVLEYLRQFN